MKLIALVCGSLLNPWLLSARFVEVMGLFNVDGSRDDKMKFLYRMFDLDNDGFVDVGDFECVLMLICGPELTDEEVLTAAAAVLDPLTPVLARS